MTENQFKAKNMLLNHFCGNCSYFWGYAKVPKTIYSCHDSETVSTAKAIKEVNKYDTCTKWKRASFFSEKFIVEPYL
jgi:hypothetical protein